MELRPWPEARLNGRWVNLGVVYVEMDGSSKAPGIPSAGVSTPCFPASVKAHRTGAQWVVLCCFPPQFSSVLVPNQLPLSSHHVTNVAQTFLLPPLRLEEEIDYSNHPRNQPDGVLRMGRELL